MIPSSAMDKVIDRSKDAIDVQLPQWIHNDSKVRYTVNWTTHQGCLHLGSKNVWSFTFHNKFGSIIKEIPLPNLPFTYKTLINDCVLQPGWLTHPTFSAFHVSAKNLQNQCPATLLKALVSTNVDHATWHASYKEEYDDLRHMGVYEEINSDQVRHIQHKCGHPIPTMCVLTIKYKDGYPDRTKWRIVVLGNQQQHNYSKSDKYAPVISQNQICCLLSLAVSKRRCLRQGDVKNAFCNKILPAEKTVVVRPPKKENPLWPSEITYALV